MNPDSIATQLKALPHLFWPAVIAALITAGVAFLGIIVSNRSNTNRLKLQLKHDSAEKRRERISQTRRSVYLDATEKFSSAMAALGALPQLDPRKDNLTETLLAFNASAAKIQLISEGKTAILSAETGKELNKLFFSCLEKCQPIHELAIMVDIHTKFRDSSQQEFDKLVERGRTSKDPTEAQLISKSMEMCQRQIEHHNNILIDSLDKKAAAQKTYSIELIPLSENLIRSQIPLSAAIREELELQSDLDSMHRRTEEGIKSLQEMLKQTLDKIS